MKSKMTRLIERVGLRNCKLHVCPKCGEIGLEVVCPDTGTSYFVHTTDYKKVCTVVAAQVPVAA